MVNIKDLDKQEAYPDCFIQNKEAYPLCKGNNCKKCHDCCLYEDYEKYHSPYND